MVVRNEKHYIRLTRPLKAASNRFRDSSQCLASARSIPGLSTLGSKCVASPSRIET
jgi:hypothetical protein